MLIYGLIQQQIASTVKWTLERLQTYSQVDIYENWGERAPEFGGNLSHDPWGDRRSCMHAVYDVVHCCDCKHFCTTLQSAIRSLKINK